ncbi:MAG: DUF1294 domain-containing protein [Paracoccaceae bacterium]
MSLLLIPLWFLALSTFSYVLMFFDKRAAVQRKWRVPEATLLIWAFLGGAVGAKLGQRRFRHKTRKQPFGLFLNAALAVNVALGLLLCASDALRATVFQALLSALTEA